MPAVGIDLGSSTCSVAVWHDSAVRVIPNNQGSRTTPSHVAFTPSTRLFGDPAESQATINSLNTLSHSKRLLGRFMSDPIVHTYIKHLPCTLTSRYSDRPFYNVESANHSLLLSVEEVIAMLLAHVKDVAQAALALPIESVVLCVPATFSMLQCNALQDAATIAGLKVTRIMSEPSAIALAYILQTPRGSREQLILIADLGGANLNLGLVTCEYGVAEVVTMTGDTRLGGEDFTSVLQTHVVHEIWQSLRFDVTSDPRAMRRVHTQCERAKRHLSGTLQAVIDIDPLAGDLTFRTTITRDAFEKMCGPLFHRFQNHLEEVLRSSKCQKGDIEEVVVVGGATRMPKIQQMLLDFSGKRELCKRVNADEAVAYGAAVQAAILAGNRSVPLCDVMVLEVARLPIGLETVGLQEGGVMMNLLMRNTTIPTKKQVVVEAHDLPGGRVRVFEGLGAKTVDNIYLDELELPSGQMASATSPQIMVTIDVDAEYDVHIRAEVKGTKEMSKMKLTNERGRLSRWDIERMMQDLKRSKVEDEAIKLSLEAHNALESLCYEVRGALEAVEGKVKETLEWAEEQKGTGIAEYEAKRRELQLTVESMARRVCKK